MGDEGPTSRVTQIRPDGTRKVLLQDEIMLSNGIAVGPDGMLYVSTGSQLAGAGAVIKVDPGEARDPAAAPACDPARSAEHPSELQSLMRTPYAGLCLKKKQAT